MTLKPCRCDEPIKRLFMKTYAYFLRYALLALPLVCAFALSSCYNDEDGDCPGGNEPVEVRLNVSAQQIGDLNGTRAGGDEHEFMHSLRVYIVNEASSVMQSFVRNPAALEAYSTAASTGDLTNWSSESFELAPGEYTVYAFANFEGHQGFAEGEGDARPADNFIHTCFEGSTVKTTVLNGFTVADPAGKIKFVSDGSGEVVYIPMSASQRITVTANTHDISIGLVRLVSKVQLTVPSAEYVSAGSTVQFSDYSENVPLLGADNGGYGNAQLYGERTAASKAMPFNQPGDVVSFYVNETNTGAPFTVTFNTGKSGNGDVSAYVAKTQRTDIPRNSIYPLSLTFPDFTPQFEWQSWEAAIGSVPVEVVVEENNYIVKIASGNTFKFTVNGVDGTNSQLQSATWAHGDVTNQITDIQIGNNAISGAISAGVPAGTQIPLTVTVNWTADYTDAKGSTETRNFTRTYNVTIETISIWGIEHKRNTRSGSWSAYRLAPEVLNMFIKR